MISEAEFRLSAVGGANTVLEMIDGATWHVAGGQHS